ncbi:uncharacterized protein [Chelonus insularis]|uniref:uncharacterized protein n=1 Tax=Chelonus insularis TaxID=460826 RepID=UPI00158B0437|nr:uncharacterized protein LOC118070678 [Chelonus insularis]XP_034945332.1 uncharacterized protein LOC118070678 [Chelonus insularis]
MDQLHCSRTIFSVSSMTILILWWVSTLLVMSMSDKVTATMIMDKKLSRLSPIDCEKYVYHPQCRGVQAKKRLSFEMNSDEKKDENRMLDEEGNDKTVEEDEKPNICVCNYKTTNWSPLMKKKKNLEMFGHLIRNRIFKESNKRDVEMRPLFDEERLSPWIVMRNGKSNPDDIREEISRSKKFSAISRKLKKKWDNNLNSSYVVYVFV